MKLLRLLKLWIGGWAKRVVLQVSHKIEYDGFTMYAYEQEEEFFSVAIRSLERIKAVDPSMYARVKKFMPRLAFVKMGIDAYVHSLECFFIDTFPKDADYFASEIIHEATHGFLLSRGYDYSEPRREQHERICLRQQQGFLRKLILQDEGVSEDLKELKINEYKMLLKDHLKTEWWSIELQREKQKNRLKSILFRSYVERVHYSNGQLKYEAGYLRGALNGAYKSFYESGKMKQVGQYLDGRPHGCFKWYDVDGRLSTEASYENGFLEGVEKKYYPDGKLKSDCFYLRGKWDGEYKSYSPEGKVLEIRTYQGGIQHGPMKLFNGNGTLREQRIYNQGVPITESGSEPNLQN